MKLISPLLKHVVYPALSQTGYLRRRGGAGPAVVTYHGVLPVGYRIVDSAMDGSLVSADSFRGQLRLLRRSYNVISPEQFLQWCEDNQELPPRSVLLTCDDGLQNTLTDMLPILQEAGLSCLFFITGASAQDAPSMLWYEELYLMFLAAADSFILELPETDVRLPVDGRQQKRSSWWELVKKLSQCDRTTRLSTLGRIREQLGLSVTWRSEYTVDTARARRFLVLTAKQLRELVAAGMSIGAHTLSHPMLSQSKEDAARDEIGGSLVSLQQVLGRPVWAFAYPFGDPASVTPRDVSIAEQAGFRCAFVNVGGGFGAETPRFAIPRMHVTGEMSLAEFEAHLSGFYRSMRHRFAGDHETAFVTAHAQRVGN